MLKLCHNTQVFLMIKAFNMMKILHTMLRVGNLERSIKFYTEVLGMKLLRTSENTEYKYNNHQFYNIYYQRRCRLL